MRILIVSILGFSIRRGCESYVEFEFTTYLTRDTSGWDKTAAVISLLMICSNVDDFTAGDHFEIRKYDVSSRVALERGNNLRYKYRCSLSTTGTT